MNATSLDELRAAQAAADIDGPVANPVTNSLAGAGGTVGAVNSSDEKMEQIRQLILGDHAAQTTEHLAALESRQALFEDLMLRRLDVISQRLDALSRDVMADRRAAFDELSRAMHELGNRVRGI